MTRTGRRSLVSILGVAALVAAGWLARGFTHVDPQRPPDSSERMAPGPVTTWLAPDPRAHPPYTDDSGEDLDEDDTYQLPERVDPADPTAPANLRVLVRVPSGTSMPDVRVTVVDAAGQSHEAVPSADGETTFSGLPPGSSSVRAEGPELVAARLGDVWLEPGADAREACELEPGVRIEGRVVARGTRAPIPGAILEFDPSASTASGAARGRFGSVTTEGDGSYRSTPLPPGDAVRVHVRARGYRSVQQVAGEVGTGPADVEIRLQPGGAVRGVVRGPDGTPRRDAWVSVHAVASRGDHAPAASKDATNEERAAAHETLSDPQGRFELDGLPLGAPLCVVAADSTFGASEELCGMRLSASAPDAECTLLLRHGTSAEIRLLGPDGVPFPRGSVTLATLGAERTEDPGADGVARLEGLSPGPALLRVESPGFVTRRERVVLPASSPWKRDVTLVRGAAIEPAPLVPVHATKITTRFLEPGGGPLHRVLRRRSALPADVETDRNALPASFGDLSGAGLPSGAGVTWWLVPGRWRLRAEFEGLAPWEWEIEITGASPMDLGELTLAEGQVIEGIVVDGAGTPLPEVSVYSRDSGDGETETGHDGRFRLAAFPRAEVIVTASHASFMPRDVRVDLRQPTQPLRIRLDRGSLVTIRVRSAAGVAIPEGLRWQLRSAKDVNEKRIAYGWFGDDDEDVDRLSSGRFRLELLLNDQVLSHEVVVLEEGKDAAFDLQLPGR